MEERASQASLKENWFETFKPATEIEIKEFLNVLVEIDEEFDVERFLDKKKPFHFSPKMKDYLESHPTVTHYSLTFKKYPTMSQEFLMDSFPECDWTTSLGAVPCPVVDKDNPHRYLSYENVKSLAFKDFSDKDRPGKSLKTPSNIPFTRSKQRALYGAKLTMVCEVCNKPRVVYFERKPSDSDVKAAKDALKNIRYICGGRISSFGRSLAVMEEIADVTAPVPEIHDEIDNENSMENHWEDDPAPIDDIVDEFDDYEEPVAKKKKKMIIESDDESDSEPNSTVLDLLSNSSQVMIEESLVNEDVSSRDNESGSNGDNESVNTENLMENVSRSCSSCSKINTWHKCKICQEACCNLCNTVLAVEEMGDIVCPGCEATSSQFKESRTKKRGRPRTKVSTGSILIPLVKKKRGRPAKDVEVQATVEDSNNNDIDETTVVDKEAVLELPSLTELRILGSDNILGKVFVDEALTCDSEIEPHMFDILLTLKKPLPCSYCGEREEHRLYSKLSDENFPLCVGCKVKGRGAGSRRKTRKVQPKEVKQKKKVFSKKKKNLGQLI